jgi:hypothetical protein
MDKTLDYFPRITKKRWKDTSFLIKSMKSGKSRLTLLALSRRKTISLDQSYLS